MAYSRTETVDANPAGDTIKQAVLDLDTDMDNIFTDLNSHAALAHIQIATAAGAVEAQLVPLDVRRLPEAPGATGVNPVPAELPV